MLITDPALAYNPGYNLVWQLAVSKLLGLTLGKWVVLNPYIDHLGSMNRIMVPKIIFYRRFETVKQLRKKLKKFKRTLDNKLDQNFLKQRYNYIYDYRTFTNEENLELYIELLVDKAYSEVRTISFIHMYKFINKYNPPLIENRKNRKSLENLNPENLKYIDEKTYTTARTKVINRSECTGSRSSKIKLSLNGDQLLSIDLDKLITQFTIFLKETLIIDYNEEINGEINKEDYE
jgi:hypothetical protein